MSRSLAASPTRRVALMCLLAFVICGGWAFGVNVGHGLATARAAGLAQGASSTLSTVIITSLIELCLTWFDGHRGGWLLAWPGLRRRR